MTRYFKHQVIDGFLPARLHDQLLERAIETKDAFQPALVYASDDSGRENAQKRKSLRSDQGLGPLKPAFKAEVNRVLPELIVELECKPFDMAGMEIELVAHQHGSHFRPHIDLRTQPGSDARTTERMLTLVYYFHRQPKVFTGGQIAILPLGAGDPLLIEPADNRLLAFASFVPHAVEPVFCEPDVFENARFAVNCWVHRTLT